MTNHAALAGVISKIDANVQINVDVNRMVYDFLQWYDSHANNRSYVYNATNMITHFTVYNGNDWMLNSWFPGAAVAAGQKTMHPGDTVYIETGGLGRPDEGMKLFINNEGPHHEVRNNAFYVWTGQKFEDVTSAVQGH